jgi:exopolyphosphatase/guanosine-5'-triphosphate,3'-diphosphate pyrophosphatase
MTRVAAIDCGTNSVRLLITDLDPVTGAAGDILRRMEIVRLGQGVDQTGRLAPEALERTFAAVWTYAEMIKDCGVERVRMVATSATRDAANRLEFVTGVQAILGIEPEVVSDTVEAELSFLGAARELRIAGSGPEPPYLVVDIGGGSTEVVLGTDRVTASCSVDVGCVRLTERHLHDDPPTEAQVAAADADIAAALDQAEAVVPVRTARTLVGVAGTVTTIAGIALGLPTYDSESIHGARVSADQVAEITARLLTMSHAERAAIPVMHPGRIDVIAAGALVLRAVVERAGLGVVIASEHDILDGIAWSLASPPPKDPTSEGV